MLRYAQQVILPEIGPAGQEQIAAARVLVIGAGGLGTPLTVYLAGAGVGELAIMDADTVSITNLPRQFLYTGKDIEKKKVSVLAERLHQYNEKTRLIVLPEMLTRENAKLINGFDIVCDCTDNADTRRIIDQACLQFNKPLVYAAVKGWEGCITVLHYNRKISLETVFPAGTTGEVFNCSAIGIVNSVCAVAAGIQATEVLKIILGLPSELDGGICCFDLKNSAFRVFKLNKVMPL